MKQGENKGTSENDTLFREMIVPSALLVLSKEAYKKFLRSC